MLKAHMGYLQRSSEAYDAGHLDEAFRIANSVRTLMHDLKGDALLTLLGVRNSVRLLSTCPVFDPHRLMIMSAGLSMFVMQIANGEARTLTTPVLGNRPQHFHFLSVDEWWTEGYQLNSGITRQALVLDAANRDGGTHVGNLRPEYAGLKEGIFTAFSDTAAEGYKEWKIGDQHFSDLRQVAFELLNSPDLIAAAS